MYPTSLTYEEITARRRKNVRRATLGLFAVHGRRLYSGEGLEQLSRFSNWRGRTIRIEAADDRGEPIPIELDGECPGFLPCRVEVLPRALELHAPWDRAQAVG